MSILWRKPSSSLRTARSVGFRASRNSWLETLPLCELRPQTLRVCIFTEIFRSSDGLSTEGIVFHLSLGDIFRLWAKIALPVRTSHAPPSSPFLLASICQPTVAATTDG